MNKVNWDDYRIAYQVAVDGSLSKAGKSLGLNHTTVLRRVNHLEAGLNIKLFIRHQRGYQLTDAGAVLMAQLPSLKAAFNQLENQLQNVEGEISGLLRVTTVGSFSTQLIPHLSEFKQLHPKLRLEILTSDQIVDLASGSVHISLRAGPKPTGPDLIVRALTQLATHYYASDEYVEKYGLPKRYEEFGFHQWVMPSLKKQHIPFIKQVIKHLDDDNIVFQSNHFPDLRQAVLSGMGIGPIANYFADEHPNLHRLPVPLPEGDNEMIWLVYHKDLKHSLRVQAFYHFLLNAFSVS